MNDEFLGHPLEEWQPMPPDMGPPLPRWMGIYWPWYKPEVPVVFTCPYCGATFSSQSELNNHISTMHPGQPPVTLAILYGIVSDRKTGLPLDGVKISISSQITYTDANGYYLIGNLTPGNYTMTLEKENYKSLSDVVTIAEGNNEINVEMDFIPALGATLYGRVTDAKTGVGINGVFVRVIYTKGFMLADVWTTTTDNNGAFLFENIASDVNVDVYFGHGFYQKVEVKGFHLGAGANELNVSMVYTGPPEISKFISADYPSRITSGGEFWAGQTVWLVDITNYWYVVSLFTEPITIEGAFGKIVEARMVLQEARFYTPGLWDRKLAEGQPRTGIRMDGTGQYTHYGIDITKSYGKPATAIYSGRTWTGKLMEGNFPPGVYKVYSSCGCGKRVNGASSPAAHWSELLVGTVEVI